MVILFSTPRTVPYGVQIFILRMRPKGAFVIIIFEKIYLAPYRSPITFTSCVFSFLLWTSHALYLVTLPLKPNLKLSSLSRISKKWREFKIRIVRRLLRFGKWLRAQSQLLVLLIQHQLLHDWMSRAILVLATLCVDPQQRSAPNGPHGPHCGCVGFVVHRPLVMACLSHKPTHMCAVLIQSPPTAGREMIFLVLLLYFQNWENGGKGYL